MIAFIPSEKIDPEKWNACVEQSNDGNIFGLYQSISLACEQWIGVVFNNYEAVLVLPIKKKLGLTYSWHPQFMGPLGIYAAENVTAYDELLGQLPAHSWWIKMYYWQQCATKHFKIIPRIYQELDMKKSTIASVRSGYNENTNRNIKRAKKLGLTIQNLNDANQVIKIFKENKGDQIANIDESSYELMSRLMTHWLQTKNGYITAVYQEEDLLAIGYFLVWKHTVMYYKGAVTENGKPTGAMHLLIDHEIEKHIGSATSFDFGGSNISSVARFYKGFGGVDREYFEYEFKKFKIL
jgi:hypothetical protein